MNHQTTLPVEHPAGQADEDRIIGQIVRRLIPFLCLLFIVNYVDRTNIAMAKLRMVSDIGINETIYGFGAGLFFIGYFIFEVPSNLILERVGARLWIARIMITWGVISSAMMFVRGPMSFYWLRFGLGAAEAGFVPGIVLYLTYWVPSRRRAAVIASFMTSTAVSGIIGNPLAGALMKLDGVGGLHGWQWLFMLEGILPVILGFVTLAILPDRPAEAHWLAPEDRDWLENELSREHEHCVHHVADLRIAMASLRLWLLSAIYFTLIMGLFGYVYWLPTIIQSVSGGTEMKVGLLSAIPYLVGAVSMVFIARHADHQNERRWHVAACAIISATGVLISTQCHTTPAMVIAWSIAAIGIFGCLAPFWALSTRYLQGGAAAGGIAIVNSIGCLAGFVAPYAIGWAKTTTGSFTGGLLVVAAALVCGAVLVLCIPRIVDRGHPGANMV